MQTNIICDFDGTITPVDTTDALLARFALPGWENVEKEWLTGAITSRECMKRQIAMIRTDRRELDAFIDTFELTPGFTEFVDFCAQNSLNLYIVSDGIDHTINRVLSNHGLSNLPVIANHLIITDQGYELTFPFAKDGCKFGMCKCNIMGMVSGRIVVIGDSHSDRCIAERASTVYVMRGKPLEWYCKGEGIAHILFADFHDILGKMKHSRSVKDMNMPKRTADEKLLLEKESKYCSYGDTVHYMEPARIFAHCEGAFLYDRKYTPYLDLQMWYSTVNFGYGNKRISDALKKQIDMLPQVATQYLHKEKIDLAEKRCLHMEKVFEMEGRIHFNAGGSQAVADSLKLVRNFFRNKSLMFSFEGAYHGRTLAASEITSSYRYRRQHGHFGRRSNFIPFPYCFRCPYGKNKEDCDMYCVKQFARLFETEYYGVWDPKANEAEYAALYVECIQGMGGYVIPPEGYYKELKRILEQYNILMVDDEVQMGFFRTGKFFGIEHFDVKPDVVVFGEAITNGLNPLSGIWAREEMISPKAFPAGSTHSTSASSPLGTATALEVVNMIIETDYEKKVMEMGRYFLDSLKDLQSRHAIIGDVDGLGLALRAEICKEDGFTPDRDMLTRMVHEGMKGDIDIAGKKYGLILGVGGYYKNVITLAPSLHITKEEIDLSVKLLDAVIRRAKR